MLVHGVSDVGSIDAGGDVIEAGGGTDYCGIDAGDPRSSCETVTP